MICTKYGPEYPTWSVQVMDGHRLFEENGEVNELQPFLVLVESRTKEAITIVAKTKLWIQNPIASGSIVNVRDRIATILIPDRDNTHLSFTISRGTTYEGVLKYRPRISDRFWRDVGSAYKRSKYEIVEHHLEKNSGVLHVVAPSAGVFEYSPDFQYQVGHPITTNEVLGFIRRGSSTFEVRPNYGGLLLSAMVRNQEAVHAGQHLFTIRAGPPSLYITVMPALADSEWYELYSPIGGKFHLCVSAGGESLTPGFKFERGQGLCYVDSGNLRVHVGLDIEGTLMEVYPEAGDDVSFGQLLLLVRARRIFVRAYVVGNFYRAPSPGAEPFVEVGDTVRAGQTLCIIEALKLENNIEADCAGVIDEILVENGQPLEYGQPLFIIKVE